MMGQLPIQFIWRNRKSKKKKSNARSTFFLDVKYLSSYRSNETRVGVFNYLATHFFPGVFGKKEYERLVVEKPLSEFFHVTYEALVLLVIENNYEYWKKWVHVR